MGFAHCLVAITVGVAGSAVLFAGPTTTADPDSPGGSMGGSQLSGPGVDLSVTIPTGWHQIPDQVHPQLLQMVYPDNCSEKLKCTSAVAGMLSTQASNAQTAAQAGEQTIAG